MELRRGDHQCGSCREVFGTLTLLGAHQHWDTSGAWVLTCAVPENLVRDSHGTWQTPEGLASREESGARLLAARARSRREAGVTVRPGLL